MKANIILGKKQLLLASLVLVLGAAVYLNWHFASVDPTLAQLEAVDGEIAKETDSLSEEGELKMLGDAKLVDSRAIAGEDYFTMAKLSRTKSHDAAIETLAGVLDSESLSEDDKQQVSAKAVAITDMIEAEARIENLVKAKGFSECVVYITDVGASVVVKTDGLTQDEATQIKNIVVSEGGIRGENISITEVN